MSAGAPEVNTLGGCRRLHGKPRSHGQACNQNACNQNAVDALTAHALRGSSAGER